MTKKTQAVSRWFKWTLMACIVFIVLKYHLLTETFSRITISQPKEIETEKLILFWTTFFGMDDFEFGLGREPFNSCDGVRECRTTNNRSLLNESDAVVFHIRDLNFADLPDNRLPHQRWIFYLLESPHHTPNILHRLAGFFNWTMTYRRDSDIRASYYVIESGEVNYKFVDPKSNANQTDFWKQLPLRKRKMVAWFVSNCNTSSQREVYVSQLREHIDVDVYGPCGDLQCPYRHVECYKMLDRDYKFYLSFENSICVDYVTEKFWNALLFNTVPIVYGGADYLEIAPKKSFINILDFKSAKELADYLKFLDSNDAEYMRYFEWRQRPPGVSILPRFFQQWCSLCRMLHDPSLPDRSYDDLHSWWFNLGRCTSDLIIRNPFHF